MHVTVERSMAEENRPIKVKENKFLSFDGNVFSCQSANLIKATKHIGAWDFRHYFWEIKSEKYNGVSTLLLRTIKLPLKKLFFLLNPEKHRVKGERKTTPTESLNLKPGEIVEVKSKEEILKTLDIRGRNRGLEFMPEMLKYCGKRFKVFKKVDRMILDVTGHVRRISNTVILEGAICDGSAHKGCQRTCFCLWREIWLKRVEKDK